MELNDNQKSIYSATFKYKPYLSEEKLANNFDELLLIERSIEKKLKNYPNFLGIDFCDVNAKGIQIRGHHSQISGYSYGDQPTIRYDFSNYVDVIDEFVNMWVEQDTPENVKKYKDFIYQGQKYGWD